MSSIYRILCILHLSPLCSVALRLNVMVSIKGLLTLWIQVGFVSLEPAGDQRLEVQGKEGIYAQGSLPTILPQVDHVPVLSAVFSIQANSLILVV